MLNIVLKYTIIPQNNKNIFKTIQNK